ncbi:MAG: hypothetical protein ABJN26_14020 [Stappiaceae bacterium]
MAENPNERTPEAIKRHKPQQTFEMKGPGGASVRQAEAEKVAAKDKERFGGDRAAKYANMEKKNIASKENVRDGTRGKLSQEMNKEAKKEHER